MSALGAVAGAVTYTSCNMLLTCPARPGMRKAGRSTRYVFGLWTGIALASAISAVAGHTLLGGAADASWPEPPPSPRVRS